MKAIDILQKVQEIQEERGKEYENSGQERSFDKIAMVFNVITGKDITPAEVTLILQILKDVRQWADYRLHEDCIIDSVSYASLKGELLYKQYNQTTK